MMVLPRFRPTDPNYLTDQWHFQKLGDIETIWADYTGHGVKVGVYDDGFDVDHVDFRSGYNSSLHLVIGGSLVDPNAAGYGWHGTAVMGLIGADNNGQGGVGVAFDATLTGINVFDGAGSANIIEAMRQESKFDVVNHSWGWISKWADPLTSGGFGAQFVGAIKYAADTGRGGLGTNILKAAGNEWYWEKRDANQSEFAADRHVILVGAVGQDDQVSYYSNRGASLLVSGPSNGGGQGLFTTDFSGADGYDNGNVTNSFGGTSGATPIVSGVVTLMLQANAGLGWRDVQEILSLSASQTGAAIGGAKVGYEAFHWGLNGDDAFNGGGRHFSNDYGYGIVNAVRAVRLAEAWSAFGSAQTSANEQKATATGAANQAIPDAASVTIPVTITGSIKVENAQLTLSLTHADLGQIKVELISPGGTTSVVLHPDNVVKSVSGFVWTFGSQAFRGEAAAGQWKVRVTDLTAGTAGTVVSTKLDVYGSAATADDVYHYTNEFTKLVALDAGRAMLKDLDGGIDWIEAATFQQDLVIDLNQGAQSKIGTANFFIVQSGTIIEKAIAGDGDDRLIGNAAANRLIGARGNDRIEGGAAADTIEGGRGNDTLDGGAGSDLLNGGMGNDFAVYAGAFVDYTKAIVSGILTIASTPAGTDTLDSIEYLAFGDRTLSFSQLSDELNGITPFVPAPQPAPTPDPDPVVPVAVVPFTESGDLVDLNGIAFAGGKGGYYMSGSGDDRVILPATDAAAQAAGFNVAYVFDAGDGNDWVLGGTLGDRMAGGQGNDTLDGGLNADLLIGGSGNDLFYVDGGTDRVVESAGQGTDTVLAAASLKLASSDEVEILATISSAGTAAINLTGSNTANRVTGNAGANALLGLGGKDVLSGGAGNDKLAGGTSNDILTGGKGRDVFVFDAKPLNTNVDRITDFKVVDDTIRIDNKVFTQVGPNGRLKAGVFVTGSKAQDLDDRIVYDRGQGALYYDSDGSGAKAQIKFALVSKGLRLTDADFLVI